MSVLELHGRPWTVFDPSDADHRAWYHEFVQTRTWSRCPVRFVVPDGRGDLVSMMQNYLVRYYVEQEFLPRSKKPPAKTALA